MGAIVTVVVVWVTAGVTVSPHRDGNKGLSAVTPSHFLFAISLGHGIRPLLFTIYILSHPFYVLLNSPSLGLKTPAP